MIKWEELETESDAGLYRTPVPGGWLIMTCGNDTAICFYPDPKHRWKVKIVKESGW
jgi:hypothetical protein